MKTSNIIPQVSCSVSLADIFMKTLIQKKSHII